MFISDRLVYLELHKTGCSHIRRVFNDALDGKIVDKHNQATVDLFTEGRIFVGSIRNPWDWYVSLWGFGCDGKGALRGSLTRTSRGLRGLGWRIAPLNALSKLLKLRSDNSQAWLATYRDANDPVAFRDWLYMLHDEGYMLDIGEGYSNSALRQAAGLMTFRYLKLFSTRAGEERQLNNLSTQSLIKAWDAEHTFIDAFIRIESLEADIFRVLEDHDMALTGETRSNILARPRTNTSSRKRVLVNYYDPDTIALVAEREQLIINKFAYEAPEL
jgi:hypothetical protein